MKPYKWLSLLGLSFLCFQQDIKSQSARVSKGPVVVFKFDETGRLLSELPIPKKPYPKVKVAIGTQALNFIWNPATGSYALMPDHSIDSIVAVADYTAVIKDLKKQFLQKIRATLDYLDTASQTEKIYRTLWGNEVYANEKKKLEYLEKQFSDPGIDPLNETVCTAFPEICWLFKELKRGQVGYRANVTYNEKSGVYRVELIRRDIFRKWLMDIADSFSTNDPLRAMRLDRTYWLAWREIETALTDTVEARRIANLYTEYQNKIFCPQNDQHAKVDSMIQSFKAELNLHSKKIILPDNPIIQALRSAVDMQLHQRLLWFTNGQFYVNPLRVTSSDRKWVPFNYDQYSARLHDSLVEAKIGTLGSCLCTTSIENIDSLIAMRRTPGKYLYPVSVNAEEETWHIGSLEDLIIRANTLNKVLLPYDLSANKSNQPKLFCYDAQDGYQQPLKLKSKYQHFLEKDDRVNVIVHNVDSSVSIVFNKKNEAVPAEDSELMQILSTIPNLATGFNANSILGILSDLSPIPGDKPTYENFEIAHKREDRSEIRLTSIKNYLDTFRRTNPGKDSSRFKYFDDFFLCVEDTSMPQGHIFDIVREEYLQRLDAFAEAKKIYNDSIHTLINDVKQQVEFLQFLAAQPDRSLMPDQLNGRIDTNPVYRTVINSFDVQDSSVNYDIAESKKVTTQINEFVKERFQLYKRQHWQIGAGIAVTFNPKYVQKTADFTTGQLAVTSNTDIVTTVVGLHYYPWGIIPSDLRFIGTHGNSVSQRISVFGGLGIAELLKQYYLGIYLDIVPGLKIGGGSHWFLHNRYQIINNQVAHQSTYVNSAGFYASINIDAGVFSKIIGLFK